MSALFQDGHALLVGVGGNLPNTVLDAEGLAGILKDPERCAYPPGQVHLLTGPQATRQAILDGLDALVRDTAEQAMVVVYFSGHGYRATSPTGISHYLIPTGYSLAHLYDTAVSGAEFTERLRRLKAQKVLVLLDCCHAGGMEEESGAKAVGVELAKAPLPAEAESLLAEGRGRVLIASSMAEELSYAGKPYSAFTLALVEALAGKGVAKKDGYVRVADLALHAREVVPGRTKDRQHPILNYEQADNFVVAYYAAGDAQAKGLPFTEEPEIEPEPGAWRGVFDQRGQTVHGPQTNIGGNVYGPVMSGSFQGPVAVGEGDAINAQGSQGFVNKPTGPVEQHFGPETTVTPAEFARLLDQLQSRLPQAGLDAATQQVVAADVQTVQQQAAQPKPNAAIIVTKLEGIAKIITAAGGAAAAAGQLAPMIQQAISWASRLF